MTTLQIHMPHREMRIDFEISSELNVREAFAMYADELGYEIIESGEQAPDLTVRNQNGAHLGAEVEKIASNCLRDHDIEKDNIDLIICWRNDLAGEGPVPILALENEIDAKDSISTPKYVIGESGGRKEGWINQWIVWQEDDIYHTKIKYYDFDDEWQLKSGGAPKLSEKQFIGIFSDIQTRYRESIFVDASFKELREFVEEYRNQYAFEEDYMGEGRRAPVGGYYSSDGRFLTFALMKSKNGFAIQEFDEVEGFNPRSRGAAQLHDGDFQELLQDIPENLRESLFVDLDIESVVEYCKSNGFPTVRSSRPGT